jgi:hypothetical protein
MTPVTQDAPTLPPQEAAAPPAAGSPAQRLTADDLLDPLFTDDLLHALAVALPSPEHETDGQRRRRCAAAVVALRSFDAQEPVEAMLATHAVLAHQFTMECYRRAARSSQTPNLNTRLLGSAATLSRAMGSALHILERRQEEPIASGGSGAP